MRAGCLFCLRAGLAQTDRMTDLALCHAELTEDRDIFDGLVDELNFKIVLFCDCIEELVECDGRFEVSGANV